MHISQVFLWCSLSVICSIGTRIFWNVDIVTVSIMIILIFLSIFFALWGRGKNILVAMIAVGLLIGLWRAEIFIAQRHHDGFSDQKWEGDISVAKPPQQREAYLLVIGKIDSLGEQDVRVLIRLYRHRDVRHGDVLHVKCTLKNPEQFSDTFDYPIYLAMQKIYYTCERPYAELITRSTGMYARLLSVRQIFENNINRVIAAPQAALANGLLFGGDDRLSKNMQEQFARTGMSHIVAVSGYNVSVIAQIMVVVGLACGLWRRQTMWFACASIFLFIAVIGFPPSGVRAAIMGMLVLFALRSGRIGNAVNAVLCALVIMLFANPYLLRYDIGFQLSFLATLGIVFAYPLFDWFFVQRMKALGISEIFFLTLSAHVFVLPVIIYHFKALSVVSLLVNVLVLPIIPLTMLLTFFCGLLGDIAMTLSKFFGWGAFILLRYEVLVIEYFASLSWSTVAIEKITTLQIIAYYAIVTVIVFYLRKKYDLS